jgi:hypothetical protein
MISHKKNNYGLEVLYKGNPHSQILQSSLPLSSTAISYFITHEFEKRDRCMKICIYVFSSALARLFLDISKDIIYDLIPRD